MKRKIKDLKAGEYFTFKEVECPKESQVWVRGEYDRSSKTYSVTKWADICHEKFVRGDKEVFVDFIF